MEVFDVELQTKKAQYHRCTAHIETGSPVFTVHYRVIKWADNGLDFTVAHRSDAISWSDVTRIRRYAA